MSANSSETSAAVEPTLVDSSPGWQLPVELLLQCLTAADLVTRIRASHVCRTCREAALTDSRLWDHFACAAFLSRRHEDAMFSLLEAMLLRSRPLPFYLAVPHYYYPTYQKFRDCLLRLEGFDIFRLAAYRGPVGLFKLLNPTQIPLPNLVFLDVLRVWDGEPDTTAIAMESQLGAHCLSNLLELVAPSARFPADCAPFTALRYITFGKMYAVLHHTLFAHCPHLVRIEIKDSAMGTPLPDPRVPPSLEEISICCTQPRALDLVEIMGHWRGVRVRRVVGREVYSLRDVLPQFLASHAQPIELGLVRDDGSVALSTTSNDESVWTLSPSPRWADDFLASIENPTFERLTSICVSFSRLGALLAAQLHTPGLEKLELRIADSHAPPLRADDERFLRAPRLKSLFFSSFDDCNSLEGSLAELRSSFRAVLIYDAELLDAVFVSRSTERACARFAPFAKNYILATSGS